MARAYHQPPECLQRARDVRHLHLPAALQWLCGHADTVWTWLLPNRGHLDLSRLQRHHYAEKSDAPVVAPHKEVEDYQAAESSQVRGLRNQEESVGSSRRDKQE